MSRVRVEAVTASFDTLVVLDGVDLEIPHGQMGAVVGPSGSGKTTLLRTISGLHRPDAGRILLGEREVSGSTWVPPERRRVGLVPQHSALFPHLTVAENVAFGLQGSSWGGPTWKGRERASRVRDLLGLAGLAELAQRMPHELSGGQQQRVALMRALAPGPEVVLLDEPFGALDAGLRAELRDDVVRVLQAAGATALLVTHDQEEALSFADRLFVLRGGRIAQSGTPAELYEAPASGWVATFLGAGNIVTATTDGTVAQTPWGAVTHQRTPPGAIELLIRPEQVELRLGQGGFRVRQRHYYGHDCLVMVSPDASDDSLAVRVDSVDSPLVGDPVSVHVVGPAHAFTRADGVSS